MAGKSASRPETESPPDRLIEMYGTPDALRYYLLRHIRSVDDGDFSEERLEAAWSGELGGQLGNLANRVLTLLGNAFDGVTPQVPDSALVRQASRLYERVHQAFDNYELHLGLAEIFVYLGEANREFTRQAPWADAKALLGDLETDERAAISRRLAATLAEQVHGLAIVARCLLPFLPKAAAELHVKLGLVAPARYDAPSAVPGGRTVLGTVLFPQRA
jgi:methionyl-tRNA synthetase